MLEIEQFQKGMKIISLITSKTFSAEQLEVYYMLLSDIDTDIFTSGIKKLAKEREFSNIPTPAEIRKYCTSQIDDINKICNRYEKMIENTHNIEYYNTLKKELSKYDPDLVNKKLDQVKETAKMVFTENKQIERKQARMSLKDYLNDYLEKLKIKQEDKQ